MQVRLLSGDFVESFAPIGLNRDDWLHPKPAWWAMTVRDVIERAIDRAAARRITNNIQMSPTVFGWGDAGLGSGIVYCPVGSVATVSQRHRTTWRFALRWCNEDKPVFEFQTALADADAAKRIALEYLHIR